MSQVQPPMPPPPAAMPDGQKKAAGIAVAALVLGICGLVPLLGLLPGLIGIILGIVALAKGTSRKGLAVAGITTGGLGMLLIVILPLLASILLPTFGYARKSAKRIVCASNLKGIGASIHLYAAENDEAYPPGLKVLVNSGTVPRQMLKCPSANSRRNSDYFYSPPPKTEEGAYELLSIIACDFKNNHGGKGRNVLFADGHTQWMSEEEFQQELQQSHNAAFAKALREAEGP